MAAMVLAAMRPMSCPRVCVQNPMLIDLALTIIE